MSDPLCVVVGCHQLVCAVESTMTERLVLPDEVKRWRPAAGRSQQGATLVESHDRIYAAWDLGTMLGLPPTPRAWMLLQIPYQGGTLAMALRTGPCLVVRPLRETTPLPRGLFRERPAALSRAFASRDVAGQSTASVGFLIDLRALWTEQEWSASSAALAAARIEGAPGGAS